MKTKNICRLVGLMAILGAGSALAAPQPPLSPDEGRKIAPLLLVAAEPLFAAAASAAPAGAPPAAPLSPIAAALGARLEHGVPVADLLFAIEGGGTEALAALGIEVDAVVGPVATARAVPLALVDDLARRPEITRLEPTSRLLPMNDVSVPETGAPGVWSDFGATGSGVVVGIVDTGLDVDHPDFYKVDGTSRVQFLLDLSQPGSGPFGGTLFTGAQIDDGAVSRDVVGHGTHVAGSAAGGGRVDPNFRGVAPEADLIIVNADRTGAGAFSDADIVNAVSFIDQKATELGKPYVTNLSLGGHSGAHDGSSLMEIAFDNLVGAGRAGKAIVIAAGNERANPPSHASGTVGTGGLELRFTIPDYAPQPGDQNDIVLINIWYETFSAFSFRLVTPSGVVLGPFAPGEWNGASGNLLDEGLIGIQNAASGADPANGDFEASFIVLDAGGVTPAPGTWRIRIENGSGPFDAYIAGNTIGGRFENQTRTTGFIAEPGCARNPITVGAYMTKIEWDDKDANHFDLRQLGQPNAAVGLIAAFSNAGPTRDGRLKPEICAPGQEIASCFSNDAPPGSPSSSFTSPFPEVPNMFILAGDNYAIQQGTSQAAPHVAGAVALLFQLHPDWDIFDVKRALTQSARADAFTGALPNELYGHGKLDILAAVQAAAPDTIVAGDVDGNNLLELADALLALDFVLEADTPSNGEFVRADMNADAVLDVGDLVLLVRAVVSGGEPAPAPLAPAGSETWIVPIAIVAEKPVVAGELTLAPAPGTAGLIPLGGSARSARDGVLAAGAARDEEGTTRLLAVALDGRSLAGSEPVLLLPIAVPAGAAPPTALTPLQVDLRGPGGARVAGTVVLGTPERATPASAAPAALQVWPVAPNPFASPARIAFAVPGSENLRVTVGIYDVGGRLVAALADGPRAPGRHEVTWDGRGAGGRPLAAGIYWARVTAGHESAAARLTVVR